MKMYEAKLSSRVYLLFIIHSCKHHIHIFLPNPVIFRSNGVTCLSSPSVLFSSRSLFFTYSDDDKDGDNDDDADDDDGDDDDDDYDDGDDEDDDDDDDDGDDDDEDDYDDDDDDENDNIFP